MPYVDYRLPQKPRRVAIQGERGSNSHVAQIGLFPHAEPLPRGTLVEAFESLANNYADLAVIPVKNTIADKVPYAMKLLRDYKMKIVGEAHNQINHCILGLKDASFESARTIYSHPHALGQCTEWLAAHPHISPIEHGDTAGAAAMIAAVGDPTALAIAPALAAKEYKMELMAENVQDNKKSNITHFLVLSRELHIYPADSRPYVTALTLEMKNSKRKQAYLNEATLVHRFNGMGHPVVHKEDFTGPHFSIPTILFEVAGHEDAPRLKQVLNSVQADKLITSYSIAGCYPTHPNRPY